MEATRLANMFSTLALTLFLNFIFGRVAVDAGLPLRAFHRAVGGRDQKVWDSCCETLSVCDPYKRYSLQTDQKVDFFEADRRCREKGMLFAMVNCPPEQVALEHQLKESGSRPIEFFIGGYKADSGSWIWSANQEPISYFDWVPGEPNNQGGYERCLQAYLRDGHYPWNDLGCFRQQYYVCQENPCPSDCLIPW